MNYLELIKKNSALSVFSFFFIIVFFSLGIWQAYKGNLKAQEEKEFYAYKPSIPYSQSLQTWSNVSLEGRFDSSRQILFDNQLLDGKPGYKVYTPFIFSDDRLIMPFPESTMILCLICLPISAIAIFRFICA